MFKKEKDSVAETQKAGKRGRENQLKAGSAHVGISGHSKNVVFYSKYKG